MSSHKGPTEGRNNDRDKALDEILKRYSDESKYILLMPTKQFHEITPWHQLVLEEVKLSIEAGDAYDMGGKKFALSKNGLMKLSNCAGIIWDPYESKRIDPMTDRSYVVHQAVGILKKSDGSKIPLKQSYELDLDVVRDEVHERLQETATKKERWWKNNPGESKWWNNESERNLWVERKLTQEMLKKRRFKNQLAETGAMTRVVRTLLVMKSDYTKEELNKTFVVPHIVFAPDMSDAAVRAAFLRTSLTSIQEAYGGNRGPVLELPAGDYAADYRAEQHHEYIDVGESNLGPSDSDIEIPPSVDPPSSPSVPLVPPPVQTAQSQAAQLPFVVPEEPKQAVKIIKTVADYLALEKTGQPASPELLAALEELKKRKGAATTKPFKDFIPAHRRGFVDKALAAPDKKG